MPHPCLAPSFYAKASCLKTPAEIQEKNRLPVVSYLCFLLLFIQYCRYGTETRHSFKNKSENSPEKAGSTNTAFKTALETYKSSVFRQGDWNVAEPRSVRHSVTCNDFHIRPFSSKADGFEETKQQDEEEDQAESEEYPVNPRGTILIQYM